MKLAAAFALALLAASMSASAAQLYRWVDDKGNVEYRDTPPPPGAKQVERRSVGGNLVPGGNVPYSVQQAAKNFPVTLWNESCGQPCDQARAHLQRRGIPYTEKNPRADVETFKKVSDGGMQVPLLMVGNYKLKGYLESEWDSTLDTAGYPRTAAYGYKAPAPPPAPQPPAQVPAGGAAAPSPPPAAAR